MSATDPKGVIAAFMQALQEKDFAAWNDLVDAKVVAHFPYAPEFLPARFDGFDAFHGATKGLFDMVDTFAFLDIDIKATEDPEFFVTTARSEAKFLSGRDYANTYVFFDKVRDGKIIEHWEHFNPLAVIKVVEPA
ncbi:nuclear transport factor 2 family protein [Sphingobium sp.]|uniref:nuclear transport factor 2 family protein n=1 Tax=Sphingobium sp. TaxID=1912891 RepID=UPI0028BD838A|nr:nuclear transport factor 2 family protein [Sphingobium sp.]